MAELREDLQKSLTELRKGRKRKFDQTAELIINLQRFDVKRNSLNLFISLPYKIKDKKVAAFLEAQKQGIDTITKTDFKKFKDKKEMKKFIKNYDFFIAQASMMPQVATSFGKVLGPAGKMPSPQLGIIQDTNDKTIQETKEKINQSIKIRTKQPSIKVAVGKESMKDEEIIENIMSVYNNVVKNLPREKNNIKNIEVKFTMTKPQKIKVI
ncbi:MAG: hypothetical protein ACOC1P_01960 [Minisyncoccales bacterium]